MPGRLHGGSWVAGLFGILTLLLLLGGPSAPPLRAQTPPAQTTPAQAASPKSILLLYSAGYYLPAYRKNLAAFFAVMEGAGFPANRLHFEHLDLIRHTGEEYRRQLSDLMHRKYADRQIDLIITVEGLARDFMLREGRDLLPDTPLLAILSAGPVEEVRTRRKIVQIPSVIDMAGTLEIGLSLFPRTNRVFVVLGNSPDERRWEAAARSTFLPWSDRLEFEYCSGLTYEEALERVGSLPPGSIVIYTSIYEDKTGRSFVPREVALALTRRSSAPVLGTYDEITPLVVGGSMMSYGAEGARAARLALEILEGRFPLTEPLTTLKTLSAPNFNWKELQRWGVGDRQLPKGSIVINRPPSIWDDYREYVVGSAGLVLLQTGMIIALLVMRKRKRHSDQKRRLAEEAIAASEQRYRTLVEHAQEGILVLQDQRVKFANPYALAVGGFTLDELAARPFLDFIHPEDRLRLADIHRRRLAGEEVEQGYSARLLDKDGRTKWLDVVGARIEWEGRHATLNFVTDITERKRAEAALQRSEEKFSKAFKVSPVWVSVTTIAEGRFLEVNDTFTSISGYTREEAIGRTSFDLNLWLDPERDRQRALELYRREGRFRNLEIPMRFKDGQVHVMLWSVDPFEFEGQDCFINVMFDITEQKKAQEDKARLEAQVRQSQKMEAIGTLAGGIAHDFNNILGVVLGFAEIAREDALAGATDPGDLDQIIASAGRAKDLVQQILAFSRKQESDLRPCDLNQIVRRTLGILERTLPKMIDIQASLADDAPPTQADPTQIEQVLLNLASNAADAMPEGGKLAIETRRVVLDQQYCRQHMEVRPGPYVLLTVSDSGVGMDEETREHIFEPFFTTKEIGKGTGLGLASAYGIVKNHGGHIHCHSEVGVGSIFKIYLPVLPTADSAPRREPLPAGREPLGGNETILLVDDEEALRGVGARCLRGKGYEVLTASSGEEALETYRKMNGRVDLVIMDLGMPGMGGHKTLKAILELNPRAKVVIATGYSAGGQVKAALESGAAGYVAKPFRNEELLAAVRGALDGR